MAQGVSVSPKGVRLMGYGDVDVEATIKRWLEIETRKIDTLINLQIECLTQECELSPVQIEKLQLARAGIVKKKIAAGQEQLRRFMIESELVEGELPSESKTVSTEKLLISGARKDVKDPRIVLFRTKFEQPLFEVSLWQGVLKSNLSEKQYAQYHANCVARNSMFLATALTSGISELDGAVCLTQKQRAEIETRLKGSLLSQVTVSFPTNSDEANKLVQPALSDRTAIDPVLTEQQRQALDEHTDSKSWVGVGWTAR